MVEKMSSPKEERLNTIIGQGTVIKGECRVNGTVRVDGVIDGTLVASGVVILGKSGRVKGDLLVHNAIVGGKVEGSVIARSRLELQTGASIKGDVSARKLIVEEGVYFDGSCSMDTAEPAEAQKAGKIVPPTKQAAEPVSKEEKKFKIEESGVDREEKNEITFRGESL